RGGGDQRGVHRPGRPAQADAPRLAARGQAPVELRASAERAPPQRQRGAHRAQVGARPRARRRRSPGGRRRDAPALRMGKARRAAAGRRLAAAAALLVLCVACPQAPPVPGPPVDPVALLEQIEKAHAEPQTLSASGKAAVDAPENGGRYQIQIVVRRPASLRIAALDPIGNPAALLVADGGRFALLDLRRNVFSRGPSTPENLSRLIPEPLRDEELVALVLGSLPPLPGARPVEAHRLGGGSVLTLQSGDLRQEASAGGDLRIGRVRR